MVGFPKRTDQAYLVNDQYRDAGNLTARMTLHERFGANPTPWQRWVFDQLLAALAPAMTAPAPTPTDAATPTAQTKPDAAPPATPPSITPPAQRILEIGCGPARLWAENADLLPAAWRVTLADLSGGMLAEAQRNVAASVPNPAAFSYSVADAQALPFADASFDAVVANHMLYHIADRAQALGEIRRVLRPGGALLAATNGAAHMRELDDLARHFLPTMEGTQARVASDFTLENGAAQLAPYFAHIELRENDAGDLVVTEAAPLVAYIASMVALGANGALTDDRRAALLAHCQREIDAHGAIRITRATGLFLARN